MHPFEEYLKRHTLEALTVSVVAEVRYLTVWNALKGHPITAEQARRIEIAVFNLTHIPYMGPMEILPSSIDQWPTVRLSKPPGRHSRH